MGSGRGLVHVGPGSGSGFGSDFHELQNLLRTYYSPLRHSLNVDPFSGIFSDLKAFLLISKQVADDFVVNLNVRSSDHKSRLI